MRTKWMLIAATGAGALVLLWAQPPRVGRDVNKIGTPAVRQNRVLSMSGQLVSCNDVVRNMQAQQMSMARQTQQPSKDDPLMHTEPPIGGAEGSFHVTLEGKETATGDPKIRRSCIPSHSDVGAAHVGYWTLDWQHGGPAPNRGSYRLEQHGGIDNFQELVVSFKDRPETVRYLRTADGAGTAWTVIGTADLDGLKSQPLRIDKLEAKFAGGQKWTQQMYFGDTPSVKASFTIRHGHPPSVGSGPLKGRGNKGVQ